MAIKQAAQPADHPLVWPLLIRLSRIRSCSCSCNRHQKCCNEAFTIANELITTASDSSGSNGSDTCPDLIEEAQPDSSAWYWHPKSGLEMELGSGPGSEWKWKWSAALPICRIDRATDLRLRLGLSCRSSF